MGRGDRGAGSYCVLNAGQEISRHEDVAAALEAREALLSNSIAVRLHRAASKSSPDHSHQEPERSQEIERGMER